MVSIKTQSHLPQGGKNSTISGRCISSASKAFGKSLGKRPAGKYKSGRSKYEAAHIIPTSGFANRSKRVQNSIKRAQDKFDKYIGADKRNTAINGFWAPRGHAGIDLNYNCQSICLLVRLKYHEKASTKRNIQTSSNC